MALDACALIAFLNGEPGADVVEDALANVASVEIASINLLEVAYDAVRKTGRPEAAAEVLADVERLPITIHRFIDDEMIERSTMSTLTLELENETNSLLQTEARKVNLSPVEFARLAIVRALARVGKDADLERRAAKSDGRGWERVRQAIPDAPPQAGDELPG